MFYKFHSKSPWLKRVLVPFWAFQLTFILALISVFIWLRAYSGSQVTNIVILIVSAICAVLSVTEIILFAATRLHPLTYLILQLGKTITWFVLFVLAAVDSTKVQNEMKGAEEQGYDLGSRSEYFYLQWFAEPLVLFITCLGAFIYASVIYHRHRLAKSLFLRSIHGKDLFPVVADEVTAPVSSLRIPRAPRNSIKETAPGTEALHAGTAAKEAVEVTLLRELGGDWEVYELPTTRSGRNSRGGRSVRSSKGAR